MKVKNARESWEENWNSYQLYQLTMKNKNYKIIIGANLSYLGSSGLSLFSDCLRICWIWSV